MLFVVRGDRNVAQLFSICLAMYEWTLPGALCSTSESVSPRDGSMISDCRGRVVWGMHTHDDTPREPAAPAVPRGGGPDWGHPPHGNLTNLIIGAGFEVHNVLGAGFLEAVRQRTDCGASTAACPSIAMWRSQSPIVGARWVAMSRISSWTRR